MKSTVKVAKTVDEAVSLALKELNCSNEEAIIEILEEPKSGLFGLIGSKDAVVKVSCEENIEELLNEVVSGSFFMDKEPKEEKPVKKTVKETVRKEKTKKEPLVKKEKIETKKEYISKETKKNNNKIDKKKIEVKKEENIVEDNLNKEIVVDEELVNRIREFLLKIVTGMGIKSNVETFHGDNSIKFNIVPENEGDIGIVIGKRGETLDAIQYIVNLVANRNSKEYIRISVDSNNYREKRIKSLESLAVKMANKAKKYNKTMRLEPMNPYERRIIHSAVQSVSGVYTVSEGNEPYRRVVIRVKRKNK